MKKATLLKIVNVLLAINFLSVASSGVMRSLFPGLVDYEMFRVAHPVAGWAMAVLAVLHLILNWSWVKSAFAGKKKPAE